MGTKQGGPRQHMSGEGDKTASFPACDKTDSLTAPFSTYVTLVAGSP